MFNMAEVWGLRPDGSNPCLHVKRFKEEKRERFLSAEEFQRLGKVLEDVSETRSAVAAVQLLMLTGCRLSEILTLRWEEMQQRPLSFSGSLLRPMEYYSSMAKGNTRPYRALPASARFAFQCCL